MTDQQAKDWLKKQAIWQIYLPAPRHISRPKFDVAVPNEVHQTDLLFLPHDRVRRKTFRYALTVVDVASRYKEAEPLTSKTAAEVADGLARIYKRSPLRWAKLLQVDPGRESMGSVSQLLAKHTVQVRRGRVDILRDQGIVERFNQTLAERLFGHRGGRVVRRCWVNLQCRGVLLIFIIVGQGPVALAVGAGGGCLDIFSLICPFSPLSPSLWETARHRLKTVSKGR